MFNILKMELRRFLRFKAFYITTLIITLAAFGIAQISRYTVYFDNGVVNVGRWLDMVIGPEFSATLLIIICIVVISFVTGPYLSGFIKNFVGQIKSKTYLIVADIIIATVYMVFIVFWMLGCIIAFGALVVEGPITVEVSKNFGLILLETLFIFHAFVMLFLCLANVFRSNVMPIVMCIFTLNGATRLIGYLIDYLVLKISGKFVTVETYFASSYIGQMEGLVNDNSGSGFFLSKSLGNMGVMILLTIYEVVAIVIATRVIRKKDIV